MNPGFWYARRGRGVVPTSGDSLMSALSEVFTFRSGLVELIADPHFRFNASDESLESESSLNNIRDANPP